jgi:hypothetical protein
MNLKLDKKLCEDFPELFRDRYEDMRTTAMCWGFQCGDGWYGIVRKLCEIIEGEVMDDESSLNKWPYISCVKEKYGTLRVDIQEGNNYLWDQELNFEWMSQFVCECCGTTKDVFQTKGWIRTICTKCERKRQRWMLYNKWKWKLYGKWVWEFKFLIRRWKRK